MAMSTVELVSVYYYAIHLLCGSILLLIAVFAVVDSSVGP
jgi:hypothetical protein